MASAWYLPHAMTARFDVPWSIARGCRTRNLQAERIQPHQMHDHRVDVGDQCLALGAYAQNSRRCVGPPRAGDLVLRAQVEVTDARNVASQIAFEVSDRRALGRVVPTGPDSFLSSEMNAQAEG
jgi:hypothetical protein